MLKRIREVTDKHGGFPPEWVKFDQSTLIALVDAGYVEMNISTPDDEGIQHLIDYTISDKGKAFFEYRRRDRIRWSTPVIISIVALIVSIVALFRSW